MQELIGGLALASPIIMMWLYLLVERTETCVKE